MPVTARRRARLAGVLYLATFATSIPALALKAPALASGTDPGALRVASILELLLAAACVGTAVVLYPLLAERAPARALAFVVSRTIEAVTVLVGVAALLALAGPSVPPGARSALVALHDGAFLLGPGILPAANALLLGTVLLETRLVPRIIPIVGIVGAPLLLLSAGASVLGLLDQVSPVAGIAAAPIALWELSLGIVLTVAGVRATDGATPLAADAHLRRA
jgi:hypothetical protein